MIFDSLARFIDNGDAFVTGDVGVEVDLGSTGLDIGVGEPVYAGVAVSKDYAGLTSIVFNLQHSDTSGSGMATLLSTRAYTLAEMKAGKIIKLPVSEGCKRYTKLTATVVGTGTAGQITAGFVK